MSTIDNRQAPPIKVKSLQGGYNGQAVIHDCSMDIKAGEIVVIMGGSGSGKSTFLRHLIGLKEPMQGDVELFGQSLYNVNEFERLKLLKGIGVAFQSGALLSSMTVAQNVALPLVEHTELDEQTIDLIVRMKLDFVGLLGKEDLLPSELSDRIVVLDRGYIIFTGTVAELKASPSQRIQNLINRVAEEEEFDPEAHLRRLFGEDS